jgi:hypothetical protein
MKIAALIIFSAIVGASLMTVFFLPFCLAATNSYYCMPPVDWLAPLFGFFGSEGSASAVFGAIWLQYFVGLMVLFAGALWITWKHSN